MMSRVKSRIFRPMVFGVLQFVCLVSWARADDHVELLTNMDYPPFIDESLPGGGLHTEIVAQAFKAAGVELRITVMPWKRILREMNEGRATGSFSWALTAERREKFIVSSPVFYSDAVIFTRLPDFKGAVDIEKRADDGKRTILCKPLGWTMPSFAPPLAERGVLEITRPARLKSCFELMLAGRADFVDVPTLSAWYALQGIIDSAQDPEAVRAKIKVVHDTSVDGGTSHILFVKSEKGEHANLLFSKGLATISRNGTLMEIIDRHLAAFPYVDKSILLDGLRRHGVLPGSTARE